MEGNKNRPANTLFKQQRLPAWQPILSPPHVSACFVVIAAIFIPIGIAIMNANSRVEDIEFRYDDVDPCTRDSPNFGAWQFPRSMTQLNDTEPQGCRKNVSFTIKDKLTAPVYMYYKLTNFYQNHRRFAKSRSENQLAGDNPDSSAMSDCDPLLTPGDTVDSGSTKFSINGKTQSYSDMKYSPCGLIAWSKFNDTFRLFVKNESEIANKSLICDGGAFSLYDSSPLTPISDPSYDKCKKEGIAWQSDKDAKFKPPSFADNSWTARRSLYLGEKKNLTELNEDEAKKYIPTTDDVFFMNGYYANESGHSVPVTTDEDLMVWMRTASLPSFRKLYRIINVDLEAGDYIMEIDEFYDVSQFDGEKAFALATVSWAGGKNDFLGIAYVVVGACALVAGIVFFAMHKMFGDRSQKAIEDLMEQMK